MKIKITKADGSSIEFDYGDTAPPANGAIQCGCIGVYTCPLHSCNYNVMSRCTCPRYGWFGINPPPICPIHWQQNITYTITGNST